MATFPASTSRIDLAGEPAFHLAALEVVPSLRQVIRDGTSVVLEPRVMQVLVVLAQAQGTVVSRATLIARCWDGRVVGDHAINRVISRLRQLAADRWTDCIDIETIIKVGYRLSVRVSEPAAATRAARPDEGRRWMLGGVVFAAIASAAYPAWRFAYREDRHALAVQLYRRGIAIRGELYDDNRQAIAYFVRATELSPDFADAWGALALADVAMLESNPESAHATVAEQARQAARRSLALDPRNVDASIALALIEPPSRRWARARTELASLVDRFPKHPMPLASLGELLGDVGTWSEAIVLLREQTARELHPRASSKLALALWSVGRPAEAEAVWTDAARIWPTSPTVWAGQVHYHLFSGRFDRVRALLDESNRPVVADSFVPLELLQSCVRAFESREDVHREQAVAVVVAARSEGRVWSMFAAWYLGALDRLDLAYENVEAYYFGKIEPASGTRVAPGPYARRSAWPLFAPPGRPLREEARFTDLTRRIGLEAYWHATGRRPDFASVG